MGLELDSKLGKLMSYILEVNKILGKKFSKLWCDKMRSKSARFYCFRENCRRSAWIMIEYLELYQQYSLMDERSRAPPHPPREDGAEEEVQVRISSEYIRFFDHFWRCVNPWD